MQVLCLHCRKNIDYSGERPRFCSFCGAAVSSTAVGAHDVTLDVTLDAAPDSTPDRSDDQPQPDKVRRQRIGGYRLLNELGQGGMGVVYEAEEEQSGRRVAIKLLAPHATSSHDSVQRFLQEGRYAASLTHPKTTFVYAAGEDEGQLYIVMELMPGGTLKELVDRSGPLPITQAVDYMLDVIDGLEDAHYNNLIHRDLKPSNCFIDSQGHAKVGDFGLSKSLVADAGLTRTGAFMGTPMFAAPEQVRSGRVTVQTDIYAVGATLYHLLTGQGPYEGDAAKVIAAIVSESPPSMRSLRPEIPEGLDRAVAWAMEKDSEKRPSDLRELRDLLEPYSSRDATIADLGRRLAALSIDWFFMSIIGALVAMLAVLVLQFSASGNPKFAAWWAVVSTITAVLYFALAEWEWGQAIGKRIMGLRVANMTGGSPRLWQTFLRALIMPGIQLVVIWVLPALLVNPAQDKFQELPPIDRAYWMLKTQILPIQGWLTALLIVAPMRRRNGFRGIHEMVTGTCVRPDRRRELKREIEVSVREAAVPADMPESIGSFRIQGDLGPYGDGRLWLAHDDNLDRTVWVAVSPTGSEIASERRTIARPSRLHWLAGGESDDGKWDAYESMHGGPFRPFRHSLAVSCDVLAQLANELDESLKDGTLPRHLTAGQIWIDDRFSVKMMDLPESTDSPGCENDERSACEFLVRMIRRQGERPLAAGEIHDLVAALEHKPSNAETIRWAAHELRAIGRSSSRGMTWDERLGVMAISVTFEWTLLQAVGLCAGMLLFMVSPLPVLGQALAVLALLQCIVILNSYFFAGGAVFAFSGVKVRCLDGSPARVGRSIFRTVVAWFPATLAAACQGSFLVMFALDPNTQNGAATIVVACGLGVGMVLHILGAIYAILSPQRNLPDLFAGTYLSLS